MKSKFIRRLYTNYRGETKYRNIVPLRIEFTATDWHPEEQWILVAHDVDKNAERGFAIKDIKEWNVPN